MSYFKKCKVSFILGILFVAVSCSKEESAVFENGATNNISIKKDSNFVTFENAESIANGIFKISKKGYSKNGRKKEIESITPIGSDVKNPSYYIVNYRNKGFLILSGDKRVYPVLAFSDEDNFDLNATKYPELLVEWLKGQDNYIQETRNDTINDRSEFFKLWNEMEIEKFISFSKSSNKSTSKATAVSCDSQPFGQPVLIAVQGPLLTTTWGQGVGYNNESPNYGCPKYSNGKTPTGCVATAMSQIMRYYQYPTNYNWSIMPNLITDSSSNGSNEISRLMKASADAVGMDWGCDGSSAETSDVPGALKSTFGFASANYASFDITTTYNELVNGYPVILRGGEKATKWLIFDVYENGHSWICDGMEYYRMKIKIPVGRFGYDITCVPSYSYHMNWGWNGSYNGWYTSWSNPVGSFSYQAGMVYNIRK